MKKPLLGLAAFLALAGLIFGLNYAHSLMAGEAKGEAEAEKPILAPSLVKKAADSSVYLELDAATRGRIGLKTAALSPATFTPECPGTARVLDGSGLTLQLGEVRLAESAFEAAKTDRDRKQQLYDNGRNATASSVEAATAVVKQAELTLATARAKIATTWGPDLITQNLGELAAKLLARKVSLLRVDLPFTSRLAEAPKSVRFVSPNGDKLGSGDFLGLPATTEAPLGGQSFLFLATGDPSALAPGASLLARLPAGADLKGFLLPRSSIVRHDGEASFYLQTAEGTFSRHQVELAHPLDDGWLVEAQPAGPVVIEGAMSLLSEELKEDIQLKD